MVEAHIAHARPGGDGIPPGVLRAPARRHFQVERREPSPALADIVAVYWSVAWSVPPGEERSQDVVNHPGIHLSVEGGHATVTGVVTGRFRRVITGSGRVVGVRFRPAGFSALYQRPASALTDRRVPAAEVLGAEIAGELVAAGAAEVDGDVDAAVQRLERVLVRRRRTQLPGARLVDDAVDHIVAHPDVTRVDQIAEHFRVSPRTLQRHFDRCLGVGPKWVVQRRRIHEALEAIDRGEGVDWSALAIELGFADQAHLVNAFTALVGHPPSRYARLPPAPPPSPGPG